MTKASGYIIQDKNGNAIHGIGATEAEAWNEVRDECGPFDVVADVWDDEAMDYVTRQLTQDEVLERDFASYPATAELLAEVSKRGGAISWGIVDGVACTNDQEAAA